MKYLPWLSQGAASLCWVELCVYIKAWEVFYLRKPGWDEGHQVGILENDTHYGTVTLYVFIFDLTSIFI